MKYTSGKAILLGLFLGTFLAASVRATQTIGPWTSIFKGIQYAEAETDTPRLMKIKAIRIDLQDSDISFFATPGNGGAPYDTTRQTGSQFMAQYPVQVGINTHYYLTYGDYADLEGLAISDGDIVSPPTNEWPNGGTLLITQDNVATIAKTYATTDVSEYWTAAESRQWFMLKQGNIYNYGDTSIHPRSAAGTSQDGRYLILMTIDGRQSGYSEGATIIETAEWLKGFGAYNGLNLDGGGSTHLLMSDGAGGLITLNSPSENRSVGSHLGVYAADVPASPVYVYADFEDGVETPYTTSPTYSGTTVGILSGSTAETTNTVSFAGDWSQAITLYDDPAVSDGWLVRHLSGSGAQSNNTSRPSSGWIGFYAKTSSVGVQAAVALDETASITERSDFVPMIDDGQWHLYEWNLEDAAQWDVWGGGNGTIDTDDFTVDSIQFIGPDSDAVIYIDQVTHSQAVSLSELYAVPVTDGLLIHLRADILGLSNGDPVTEWPDAAMTDSVDGTVRQITLEDPQYGGITTYGVPTYLSSGFNGLPAVRFTRPGGDLNAQPASAKQILVSEDWNWSASEGLTVFIVGTGGIPGTSGSVQRAVQVGERGGANGKNFAADLNSTQSGARFGNGSYLADNPFDHGDWHISTRQLDQGDQYNDLLYTVDGTTLNGSGNTNRTIGFVNSGNVISLGGGYHADANRAFAWLDWYDGDIAEVLLYNKQLTANQMQQMLVYLNQKYDLFDFNVCDFEPDGDVDTSDLVQLAEVWLLTDQDAGFETYYDISVPSDGVVNLLDLTVFAENWLK